MLNATNLSSSEREVRQSQTFCHACNVQSKSGLDNLRDCLRWKYARECMRQGKSMSLKDDGETQRHANYIVRRQKQQDK